MTSRRSIYVYFKWYQRDGLKDTTKLLKCYNLTVHVAYVFATRFQRHLTKCQGDISTSGWRPYVDFTENMEQFPGFSSGKSVVLLLCFIRLSLGKFSFARIKLRCFFPPNNSQLVMITFCCLCISGTRGRHSICAYTAYTLKPD